MLSEKDFKRIVREMDKLKNQDAVDFLRKTSPWFDPLEKTVIRAAAFLKSLDVFYLFYGLRALPLYGVPYISSEILFAVKSDGRRLNDLLSGSQFRKLLETPEESRILDLQSNKVIKFIHSPAPLNWDEEIVERALEKNGVKIASTEDYVISLLASSSSTMRLELATKTIYSNLDEMDLQYLEKRAERFSVWEKIRSLIDGLRNVVNR